MAAGTIATENVRNYLQRVDRLYADVRDWMTALEPDAQFSETTVELDEMATGPYEAKCLEIARSGKPALRLVPRGRYMLGAEGMVEAYGLLGREILVWVRAGAPALGFRFSSANGEGPEEVYGDPMFPGVAEGWAWNDEEGGELLHLDPTVFGRILKSIGDDA